MDTPSELTREWLESRLLAHSPVREMAELAGCSESKVRYWLRRHGLALPKGGARRAAARKAWTEGRRELRLSCRHHGMTAFAVYADGHYRCKKCRSDRVAAWRRRAKRRLVEEFGGGCALCGYDRSLAALQFHHLDPQSKEFGLALQGRIRAYERLRKEAEKCVLLCANCHAEVEAGVTSLPGATTSDAGESAAKLTVVR